MLLCACFSLLAFWSHFKRKPLPAVICLIFAVFSNALALLLPVLLIAADTFVKKERRRPASYAFYLIPVAGYLFLRLYAKLALLPANLSDNLLAAPLLVVNYLVHMLYPFNQKVLYDVQPSASLALVSSAAIVALIAAGWHFRKNTVAASSLCWFLLFIIPAATVVPLPHAPLMADRYGYLALMGFALFASSLICKIPAKFSVIALLIICLSFGFVDLQRNNSWRDNLSISEQMVKDAPDMSQGYAGVGLYYYNKGDVANSEKYLLLADTKKNVTAQFLGTAATAMVEANRLDAAAKLLQHQIQLDPSIPQSYLTLQMIYAKEGKAEESKAYADKASKLFPGIQETTKKKTAELCSQAEAFITMRTFDKAERLLHEALTINPDFVPALIDLASVSAEKGDAAKAVEYFSKAIALEPDNAAAHFNLAQVYQMQGKADLANKEMEKFQALDAQSKRESEPPRSKPAGARP
jgi:tetratricopeptide (TPR) repeat protein